MKIGEIYKFSCKYVTFATVNTDGFCFAQTKIVVKINDIVIPIKKNPIYKNDFIFLHLKTGYLFTDDLRWFEHYKNIIK